ncbi:MAG TPA: hypothetical protein VGM23_01850, partial [Armatimonadota bacterium]
MRTALHGLVLAGVFTVGSLLGPYLWHLGTASAQDAPTRGLAGGPTTTTTTTTTNPNNPNNPTNPNGLVQPAFPSVLRAKSFQVVDDTGKARIDMSASALGAKIVMYDTYGKQRILLETQGGTDTGNNVQSNTKIYLMDTNGKPRVTIADNGGADKNAAVGIYDTNGLVRTALGYADKENPYLAIYNNQEKNIYLISASTIASAAAAGGTTNQPGGNQGNDANKFFTAQAEFAKFRTSGLAGELRQFYGSNAGNYDQMRYQAIMDCLGGVDPVVIQNKMGTN